MSETKEKEVDKLALLKEVNEKIKEMDDIDEVEGMIQNSCIEFDCDNEFFRVKKPGRLEKLELRKLKTKKKNELLRDPDSVTEKELVDIYLNRSTPIDIEAMRIQIKMIQRDIENMAKRFVETPIESDRKDLEVELTLMQEKQNELFYEISELMDSSMEKQLRDYVQEFLISLCLEKKTTGGWAKYYKDYDDFMSAEGDKDEDLLYKATWYFSVLINKND